MRGVKREGYTIVEMLVAVAIFSLAFITISVIFLGFTGAQSRAAVSQRLLNEGSYMLELVAREIRMHAIDYSCAQATTRYVCLHSIDGEAIRIQFDATAAPAVIRVCKDYDASPCTVGSPKWVTLSSSDLSIADMQFQIFPSVDPLGSDVTVGQIFHPLTTITMTVAGGRGKSYQTFDLQTAVSSRVYGL